MQSLDTKSSRPRRDLKPSRLQKTGLETRLETETKSRDSIAGIGPLAETKKGPLSIYTYEKLSKSLIKSLKAGDQSPVACRGVVMCGATA